MPDFDLVAGLRGPRLADLSIHVRDVLSLALPVEEEFETGKVAMATFDFVPYALSGLASAMVTPTIGTRPSTTVTVPIADDKGGTATATRVVTLYGPGDVLGVDPGQIVRRYPAPGSTNAEETFHAHIEFDRPELPWAFSAHTPDDRMPAWLALIVLETHELAWEPSQTGVTPIARVTTDRLPDLGQAWAFAHAQAAGTAPGASVSLQARLSTAYAPVNVSRLLGARVLSDSTDYIALLVPTTDAGVKAGLGLGGGTLDPAWTRPAPGQQGQQVRLPVYDRWQFRTAPDGDFARLARRLAFLAAPWAIGRRFLDTSRPGSPLDPLANGEQGRRQVIRCALYSPNPAPPGAPSDTAGWTAARRADLQAAVERPAVIEGTAGVDPGAPPALPIIGPRLYARGQVARGTVATTDWFAELNLAPANRVVAGLGTRVVVKDQERLMQSAWAQVGEVEKANRALALAELARHLAGTLHRRLATVDDGRLLQLVRPLSGRVSLDGSTLTLAGQTARSSTPATVLAGSARRALRVGGPLTRRLSTDHQLTAARLVADRTGLRDFARPYVEVDGIRGLSATALATLDTAALGTTFGVAPDQALATVRKSGRELARTGTLTATLADPTRWQPVSPGVDIGAGIVDRLVDRVRSAIPDNPAADPVGARWIGGLAAGLVESRAAGTEALRDESLTLDAAVMRVAADVAPAPVVRGGPGRGPADTGHPGSVVLGGTGAGGLVSRAGSAEVLRGGALRGGATRAGAGPVGGTVRGGTAPISGLAGPGIVASAATAAQPVSLALDLTPQLDRTVRLSGDAAGGVIGSIIRPVAHPDGFAAAVALPSAERLARLRTAQGTALGAWLEQAVTVTTDQLRAELMTLVTGSGALDLPLTPSLPGLAIDRGQVLTRLDPGRTVIDVTRARLHLGAVAFDVFAESLIRPIMAAPRFDRPMYKALDEYDREWLVPGLGTLAEPELVTLLSTNDVFTEAFLVGLSDEMARELLWREYPTDARGTYFHRFWNPTKDELRKPIHRFGGGRLGSHVDVGPPGQSGRAVVVIRGELVRRYPDLTVMALRQGRDAQGNLARTAAGNPVLPEVPDATNAAPSLFMAPLPPDIMLAGLDITIDQLREPGWWIVLGEHPQAARFRAKGDHDSPADDDLRFAQPAPATPPELPTGATEASARLAQPVRIAFDAADFLPAL